MTSTRRPRRHDAGQPRFARLRGWGGVTAMGALCTVTAVLTLLILSPADDAGGQSAPHTTTAVQAKAEECTKPPLAEAHRPTVADIQKRRPRKLIVGVDQNSFGWGFRDPASPGTLRGFDIELAHAIAADILGDPNDIIFRTVPTDQRVDALNNGDVDLVVRTMTINCLRDVTFSTPYFEAGLQVLAPRADPSITGFDASLKDKRVCTAQGTTAHDTLNSAAFKNDKQVTVPNQLDCLVRLQLGEADAMITDKPLAAGLMAQDSTVVLRGDPINTEYYGVAASSGNDDLANRVNKVLVKYRAGGDNSPWMTSYKKWLKTWLPGITAPPPPTAVAER